MDWMSGTGDGSEDLTAIVDRQQVLALLETEMLSRGRLTSVQIIDNKMNVSMSGMSLDQISDMFAILRRSPIVSDVALDLASTEDGNVAAILDFTVRITLRQAEEVAQ